MGSSWVLPNTSGLCPVSKVTPRTRDTVDLIGLQHQELSLNKLIQKKSFSGLVYMANAISPHPCQERREAASLGDARNVWVIDLIALAHEQEHSGIDWTIQRVELTGW